MNIKKYLRFISPTCADAQVFFVYYSNNPIIFNELIH
ncbi:hypothetical protein EPIR_0761 [Erwinia piriflorinigrans CFBP 5888]|uniref:Uncharacterized protein n=1 Tax=Erwinia piriflorinigrans CFBP 5888 TaxID=1161919 RepID=V5Z479_9GAMM|nr:hypothetical protein EPIR_0761 [Erwinia piriflorinigrans CFBP 5888]